MGLATGEHAQPARHHGAGARPRTAGRRGPGRPSGGAGNAARLHHPGREARSSSVTLKRACCCRKRSPPDRGASRIREQPLPVLLAVSEAAQRTSDRLPIGSWDGADRIRTGVLPHAVKARRPLRYEPHPCREHTSCLCPPLGISKVTADHAVFLRDRSRAGARVTWKGFERRGLGVIRRSKRRQRRDAGRLGRDGSAGGSARPQRSRSQGGPRPRPAGRSSPR